MHVALLGDSIFDNGVYTAGEPDVAAHLQGLLGDSHPVTLCALDGSRTFDLEAQLAGVPPSASHLVISIGGNDALSNRDLLGTMLIPKFNALSLFADRVGAFERAYRATLDKIIGLGRRTAICTIYNGNLAATEARLARVLLMAFNDVILRYAFERRLAVIDLRFICNTPADYANPIEPSGSGGLKIAQAIARWLGDGAPGLTGLYTG